MHRCGFLPVCGPQAIGPGVSTANDNHSLASCGDLLVARNAVARSPPVLLSQVVHRKMNSLQVTPWDIDVPRLFSARGQQNGIEVALQGFPIQIDTHVHSGSKLDTLSDELIQTPVDHELFHFEIRNAITKQSAQSIVSL